MPPVLAVSPETLHVMYLLLVVALQEVRATELTRQEEEKVTEEHQERPLENAGQRHPGSLQRVAWGGEKERPLGNAGQRHQGLYREWPGVGGEGKTPRVFAEKRVAWGGGLAIRRQTLIHNSGFPNYT